MGLTLGVGLATHCFRAAAHAFLPPIRCVFVFQILRIEEEAVKNELTQGRAKKMKWTVVS